MGLKCSVLGHRYGDPEYVEERDRQGSEVVLTAREVKTCERCGDTLVVSESKEVTAIEEPAAEPTASEPTEPQTPAPDPEPTAPQEIEEEHQQTAEEDDGIILEDEPEEREHGEWPEVETAEDDEPSAREAAWPSADTDAADDDSEAASPPPAWPESSDEDEGFDAVAGDVDDELADEIVEAVQSTSEPTGEETASGFFRAAPIDSPGDPDEGELRTEYFCPQCNWTAPSLTTSVRRGDVCPDCRRGYLAERDDA